MEHRFSLPRTAPGAHAALTSESFLRDFAHEVGVTVTGLESDTDDPSVARSTMHWTFSTAGSGIPDLARTLLPEQVRLRWDQAWGSLVDDRAVGRLEVTLLGRPSATCTGRAELVGGAGPTRGGPVGSAASVLSTATRTESSLPRPLGPRIEAMIDRELVGWILSVHARVLARG